MEILCQISEGSHVGTWPYRPAWQSGSWWYCLTWNPHVRTSSWQRHLCLSSSCYYILLVRRMDQYTGHQNVGSKAFQPSWCGSSVSAPSGREKSCLHAFRLGTLTWHRCSHLSWSYLALFYSTHSGLPLAVWHLIMECPHYIEVHCKCHLLDMLQYTLSDDLLLYIMTFFHGFRVGQLM
jgi:hypothetical protein